MAFYPLPDLNAQGVRFGSSEDFAILDYEDRAPNRAAGFVVPRQEGDARSEAAERVAEVVAAKGDDETDQLLRHFTGSFTFTSCHKTSRL